MTAPSFRINNRQLPAPAPSRAGFPPPSFLFQPRVSSPMTPVASTESQMRVAPYSMPLSPGDMPYGPLLIMRPEAEPAVAQRSSMLELSQPQGAGSGYRGDLTNPNNRSADIPEEENCSIWLTNLPANCDVPMLLGSIRNVGRVRACNINPPGPRHATAAAKIVFFERVAVDRLFAQHSVGELRVGDSIVESEDEDDPTQLRRGTRPHVVPHRSRVAAYRGPAVSRVLHFQGPRIVVNADALLAFFAACPFKYQLDGIERRDRGGGGGDGDGGAAAFSAESELDFRFSSHRGQAERAMRFVRERKENSTANPVLDACWRAVKMDWGVDPCE
jgi:hypothetical protein